MNEQLKKSLIIMIVFFIFISIGAISAHDTDLNVESQTSDENATFDNNLKSQDTLQTIETKTFTDLNADIANKTEVNLESNYVYSQGDEGYKNGIKINKTVIINGNGFTINSGDSSKLFNVESSGNLTINNLIILSNHGDTNSNEASFKNMGHVTLNNVTFTSIQNKVDDITKSLSSSIYNMGTLTIENSFFINSIITTNRQSYYGLIKNDGELKIKNTIFDNNRLIESCTYDEIYATNLIYNLGNLTLNQVNVTNNFMKTPKKIYGLIKGVKNNIVINNSYFENNSVKSDGNVYGVIVYTEAKSLTIVNSKFINTTGASGAGVIYSKNPNSFINNTFEKNTAKDHSGAIYTQGESTYINNTFKDNVVGDQGGAIYTTANLQADENHLFTGNIFINNKAKEGGAIYTSGSLGSTTLPIENNIFINNSASKGGAIFRDLTTSEIMNVRYMIFQDNYAPDGSVIYNYREVGTPITNITYSIFDGNYGKVITSQYTSTLGYSGEYNYWGSNTPDFSKITTKFTPEHIIIIVIEGNETLNDNSNYTIYFKDNFTNEAIKLMPEFSVDLKSKINKITPKSITLSQGQAVFTYIVEKNGTDTVKIMKNDEEITKININVVNASNIVKKPIFTITAEDINKTEKLNLKFTITEGPKGNNIYNWTIIDNAKNIVETGFINENGEISYKNQYEIGNYTIIVKLTNVEGWQDLEVNDSFEIKNIENNVTKPDTNNTNNTNNTNTTTNQTTNNNQTNTDNPNINSNTIQKQTTKIIAKKITFKAKKKVKKYTITLKAGNVPLKNMIVTLKIKGKTYKAKTNAKGKATFKIKKLNKKRKYKSIIKFNGNNAYKACSKKVTITVKK